MSAMLMKQLEKRKERLEKRLEKEDVSALRAEQRELESALNALSTYAPEGLKTAMKKRLAIIEKKIGGKSDEDIKKELGLINSLLDFVRGTSDYAPRKPRAKKTVTKKGKK